MPTIPSSVTLRSPATASRRSQRTRTSSSTLTSSSSTSPSAATLGHPPERCSIRRCLRRLCRAAEGRADTPSTLPPLDATGSTSRCQSMMSLLGRGPALSPKQSRAGSSDLDAEVPPEMDEDDMAEKEEDMTDQDNTEPHISFTYTTAHSSSDDHMAEDQVDATLPVSTPTPTPTPSPSPRLALADAEVASQSGLSPGRVRRRDSDDDELDDQLSTFTSSSSPRHLIYAPPPSIDGVSPPPPTRAPLGQAPIPFRTSFLPQPPTPPAGTGHNRPSVLPNLSRYTQETDTAPNELPIYRHYRQVRRRTALSAARASHSGETVTLYGPRGNDVTQRGHLPGPSHLEHAQGQAGVESHGDIEFDTQSEAERPDIVSHSPRSGSSRTGTVTNDSPTPSATADVPTIPFANPVPVDQVPATAATGAESPTYSPPTPPAMFMASYGMGTYPAASADTGAGAGAGVGAVPPSSPVNTDTSVHPIQQHWQRHQQQHHRAPSSWSDVPPLGESRVTRRPPPGHTDTARTTNAMSEAYENATHVPSIREMLHRQHHSQQTPQGSMPENFRMGYNWDTAWSGRVQPVPNTTRHHIEHGPGGEFYVPRPVFNPFEFYQTAQHLPHPPPPPPFNVQPPLFPPGPPLHTASMPSRTESLYSRLARLDSLRSENPVYRGEMPRPSLPVNEMTSTRRSAHHGRTASSVTAYDDHHMNLPPIPPYGHDSTYQSTTSQWSSSSTTSGTSHSRWASRGGGTASNAGSLNERELRRPISRQDTTRVAETTLSWFSNSYPFDDIPYSGVGGTTETPRTNDQRSQDSTPPSPPAATYGGSPPWNPEEAFPQSLLGEWGDLMGHVPIDTIGEGLHDPMLVTARDNVHPFARTRDETNEDYHSTSDQSTVSVSPPPPAPPALFDFMEPVPPLVPSRPPPPFDPFRTSEEHLSAFVAARSRSGVRPAPTTGPAGDAGVSQRSATGPTRDPLLNEFLQSHRGRLPTEPTFSGPLTGGDESSSGFNPGAGSNVLWMADRSYTNQHHSLTHAQAHANGPAPAPAQGHAHAYSHRRNHGPPPGFPPHTQAQNQNQNQNSANASAARILTPSFLRHYRLDKDWPLDKQKHIVSVVVRLLNSFTPAHKKLEAQSVLRYVYWDDAGNVCETRGMEKETCCAVCYEDASHLLHVYRSRQKLT